MAPHPVDDLAAVPGVVVRVALRRARRRPRRCPPGRCSCRRLALDHAGPTSRCSSPRAVDAEAARRPRRRRRRAAASSPSVAPRRELPPPAAAAVAAPRRGARLAGRAFGVTEPLFNFWHKAGFVPVALQDHQRDDGREHGGDDPIARERRRRRALARDYDDFRRRIAGVPLALLRSLPCGLALCLLGPVDDSAAAIDPEAIAQAEDDDDEAEAEAAEGGPSEPPPAADDGAAACGRRKMRSSTSRIRSTPAHHFPRSARRSISKKRRIAHGDCQVRDQGSDAD